MNCYVFSGFACNGKSTIIQVLKNFIRQDVIVFEETARIVNDVMEEFEDRFDNFIFEKEILASEHTLHQLLFQLKDEFKIVLKDRSIFDVLTFMVIRKEVSYSNVFNFLKENYADKKNLANIYSKIYFLKGTQDEKFIKKILKSDELRNKTVNDFFNLQCEFENTWFTIVNGYMEETNTELNIEVLDHPKDNNLVMWKIYSEIVSENKVLRELFCSCGG